MLRIIRAPHSRFPVVCIWYTLTELLMPALLMCIQYHCTKQKMLQKVFQLELAFCKLRAVTMVGNWMQMNCLKRLLFEEHNLAKATNTTAFLFLLIQLKRTFRQENENIWHLWGIEEWNKRMVSLNSKLELKL